jgi:hypothetical protein
LLAQALSTAHPASIKPCPILSKFRVISDPPHAESSREKFRQIIAVLWWDFGLRRDREPIKGAMIIPEWKVRIERISILEINTII